MNAIKMMKNTEKAQVVFAFIAAALFIAKVVLFEPIVLCLSEWRIVNCIFGLPFLVTLLCVLFGRKRNPRKATAISLLSFLPGMIISAFSLSHYCMMISFNHLFGKTYNYILPVIMLLILYIIFTAGCFPKVIYSAFFTFLLSSAADFSFISYINEEKLQTIEMLAYTFLFAALLFYVPKMTIQNEYDSDLFSLFIDNDDNNEMSFDIIVDLITESYLTTDNYKQAKTAQDFYYAIKNENNDKLAQLKVSGRKKIAAVFALWLECEDEFYCTAKETLFFNLCKYMMSDKISDKEFNYMFYKFCRMVQNDTNTFGTMDIRLKADEPANILSNLYDDSFTFDDIEFASIESLLQGLKFKNQSRQAKIFKMSGRQAKKAGKHHNRWKLTGNLYFKGKKFSRYGKEYQNLIAKAYFYRYEQSEKFRQALLDTGLKTLEHSIGKTSQHKTILTEAEYLDKLNYFRELEFSKYYSEKTEEE